MKREREREGGGEKARKNGALPADRKPAQDGEGEGQEAEGAVGPGYARKRKEQ